MEDKAPKPAPKPSNNPQRVVAFLQISLLANRQVVINTDRTDPTEMLAMLQNAQSSLVQQIIRKHQNNGVVVARALE